MSEYASKLILHLFLYSESVIDSNNMDIEANCKLAGENHTLRLKLYIYMNSLPGLSSGKGYKLYSSKNLSKGIDLNNLF